MIRLLFLLFFCATPMVAQSLKPESTSNDSLVDVFPLALENQWIYHYDYAYEPDPYLSPMYHWGDTGSVNLRIVGKVVAVDSTRWVVQESGSHWTQFNSQPWSGPQLQIDTFEIVESSAGNHRMYQTGPAAEVRRSVLPFVPDLIDTALVFRYAAVDSGGLRSFTSRGVDPGFAYIFRFKRAVGLASVSMHSTITGWPSYWTSHALRSSTLVGVSDRSGAGQPERILLEQNYPNPFNPKSDIRYQISDIGYVSLVVYDLLGREVMVLVNEVLKPGRYTRSFDGTGLASGVYVYQLRAGGLVATRKMVLVR